MPGVYEALNAGIKFQVNETRSKLAANVLMPSRLHLLLFIDGRLLSAFMRDFKKYTAQKVLPEICGSRRIWQFRYDRQVIWSEDIFLTKMSYIHDNPVKAELVSRPEDWVWSSAADYMECRKGPLDVWMEWH